MQCLNPCLFLDRDGTINIEKNFIKDPEDVELIPGAALAIRDANELGLKVIVVSNQSGIARGILTEDNVKKVNKRLIELLSDEGALVDDIYYCPHEAVSENGCSCRKPNSGMFERARTEHGIDFRCSIMVGDRMSDIEAGKRIGAKTVLVLTGYGADLQNSWDKKPKDIDIVVPTLYDSMKYIREVVNKWKQIRKDER